MMDWKTERSATFCQMISWVRSKADTRKPSRRTAASCTTVERSSRLGGCRGLDKPPDYEEGAPGATTSPTSLGIYHKGVNQTLT